MQRANVAENKKHAGYTINKYNIALNRDDNKRHVQTDGVRTYIWWRFRHVIKVIADVESILNENEFLGDTVDTLKGGVKQHRKRECLKGAIREGKVLDGKKMNRGKG